MPSRMMKTKTARKVRKARKGKVRKRREQNKEPLLSFRFTSKVKQFQV